MSFDAVVDIRRADHHGQYRNIDTSASAAGCRSRVSYNRLTDERPQSTSGVLIWAKREASARLPRASPFSQPAGSEPMSSKDDTSSAASRPPAGGPALPRLTGEFRTVLRSLWKSEARMRVLVLAIGIAVVIVVTAVTQVRLNAWNQPFYDAIQH